MACEALHDAKALGFTSAGVNFTGGEPFLPESNLPQLLKTAHSLNLKTRINTNAWWGTEKSILLGDLRFASCGHVIRWLRDMEVEILALSFDKRFMADPHFGDRTISVIRECEAQGQPYQVVITGAKPNEVELAWHRLTSIEGIVPHHMIPVHMDLVDLGSASELPVSDVEVNASCDGKGFFRPIYLHISPSGGVRTCLYAASAEWLGNLNTRSLRDIRNEFDRHPVVERFRRNTLSELADEYLTTYSECGYRLPKHPCASSVLIVKLMEELLRIKRLKGRSPTKKERLSLIRNIAADFNLGRR